MPGTLGLVDYFRDPRKNPYINYDDFGGEDPLIDYGDEDSQDAAPFPMPAAPPAPSVDDGQLHPSTAGGYATMSGASTTGMPTPSQTALQRLAEHANSFPHEADYKPKWYQKLGAIATGALAGWQNADWRNRPVDVSDAVFELGHPGYTAAMRKYGEEENTLRNQAQIEAKQAAADQAIRVANAKAAAEQARQAHYEGMERRAGMPKPPAPMTVQPGASVIDPSTGKVIYSAPGKETPDKLEKVETTDDHGNVKIRWYKNGVIDHEEDLGRVGKSRESMRPDAGEKPMSSREATGYNFDKNKALRSVSVKTARELAAFDKDQANALLPGDERTAQRQAIIDRGAEEAQQIQDTYEQRIVDRSGNSVTPFDMRAHFKQSFANGVAPAQEAQAPVPTGAPSKAQAPVPTGAPSKEQAAAVTIPPEVASKLKEGVTTTFANGQKWTIKGGKPFQVK